MQLDLTRPVHSPDGAPPRPASLAMLKKLSISDEVDLGGWDDEHDNKDELDSWRNEQGISTRWSCFSCSDSGYMAGKRRFYSSEVSLLLSVLCVSYDAVIEEVGYSQARSAHASAALGTRALARADEGAMKHAAYLTQCAHDAQAWEYTAQLLTVWRRLAEPAQP